MTTSTSSLTREELEEAIDRMRTVTGAVAVLFQTFISTFGPVCEQVHTEFTKLAESHPWLLELPPNAEDELADITDEFGPDPHPFTHGWDSNGDGNAPKCIVCGYPPDDKLHEGLHEEFELPKPMAVPQPAPGTTWRDICVDCGATQSKHPNSKCDAFACETTTPERGQR